MKIRIEQEPSKWEALSIRDRAKYIHQSIQNHFANGDSLTDLSIDDIRHQFDEGGKVLPSFDEWINALASAWGITSEQVLDPRQYYDYEKYYKDNPQEAWNQIALFNLQNQRELTEEEKEKLHFPDNGKSGTYKTLNHPTHPEMGYSWNKENTTFYPSERQFYMSSPENYDETNTDRILDYLGRDLKYNRGASKAIYDNGIILPTTYVTPRENYQILERNPLDTGWQYKQEEYKNGGNLIHQYDEGGPKNKFQYRADWYTKHPEVMELHAANGITNRDNIGIQAAMLKAMRESAQKDNPDADNDTLDRMAMVYYNRGEGGARSYLRSHPNNFGYNFNPGIVDLFQRQPIQPIDLSNIRTVQQDIQENPNYLDNIFNQYSNGGILIH